jgi:hypothetical protein
MREIVITMGEEATNTFNRILEEGLKKEVMKEYYFYKLRNESNVKKFVGIKELKDVDSYNSVLNIEKGIICKNNYSEWHCPFIVKANNREEMIEKVLEEYKEEDNVIFLGEDIRSVYSYDVKLFYEIEDEVVRVKSSVRDNLEIVKLARVLRKKKDKEVLGGRVYYTI